MKRKIITLLLLLIAVSPSSFGNGNSITQSNRKQISLRTSFCIEKRGRTAVPTLCASICYDGQVIEIESSGLSDAEVIIMDSDNNVVEWQSTAYLDFLQLAMPQ